MKIQDFQCTGKSEISGVQEMLRISLDKNLRTGKCYAFSVPTKVGGEF